MAHKKSTTIPIQLIELEDENFHILVETQLGNGFSGKWVIDTGASKTVFDVNLSDQYRLCDIANTEIQSAGIGEGHIETQVGMLTSLKIGEIELKNETVAIIDLKFINQMYSRFTNETIVGLIGSDFLVKHQAIINFKKKELKLYYYP
jgi:hypothetical protein